MHSCVQLKFECSLRTQTGLDMNDTDTFLLGWTRRKERDGDRINIVVNLRNQEIELE